jgi:uncharacterized membrane protein
MSSAVQPGQNAMQCSAISAARTAINPGKYARRTWSVYDSQVRAESVLNLHYNVGLAKLFLCLQLLILALYVFLKSMQAHCTAVPVPVHHAAPWLGTSCVVLHVQCDWAPRFGPAANMIELKAHQGLHQSCAPRERVSHLKLSLPI